MPPVPTSVDGMERKTLVQKEQDVLTRLPLPPHWRRPAVNGPLSLGALQRTIFNILCVASFGHVGLSPVWASIRLYHEGDDSVWVEGTRQLLLMATSAAFITKAPPKPEMLDYNIRGPYICMLCACGLFIESIIVTAVAFLVLSKAGPIWFEHVLYSTRFHVYSTLIMLSYPLISIGSGAALLGVGEPSASRVYEPHLIDSHTQVSSARCGVRKIINLKAISLFVLCLPFAMGVLFSISYLSARPKIPVP
ncbi:hypothetical protein B0H14DRAFT_2901663 [Mycena olivaceomarginata]|nr:hypothetical protein B0H14DRAFT_2901663 [Mycena olivaceomarginata]